MYASAANTPARLAKSTTSTQYLANTGTSNVPAWNEVALATGVSGTLPVGNGGTGAATLTDKAVLISQDSGTDTVGAVALTSSGQLIIGGSGGPAAATITAGTNITVTNGANSITVAAASGLDAASQVQMEAASANTVAVTPGRTQYHPGAVKAWGQAIANGGAQGLYNIASIGDTGTGDRDVNFTTSFSNSTFAVVAGGDENTGDLDSGLNMGGVSPGGKSTGDFNLEIFNSSGTAIDFGASFAVFGDFA